MTGPARLGYDARLSADPLRHPKGKPVQKVAMMAALAAAALCWGCRTGWIPGDAQRPSWVQEPAAGEEHGRLLSAIGVGEPGMEARLATAQADLAARDRLRRLVSDYTRSALTRFMAANPQYGPISDPLSEELVGVVREEVTTGLLRLSTRDEEWHAPDGSVYVLYRLPLTTVHAEISRRTREALASINPFGASAEKAIGDLDEFLKVVLTERLKDAARRRPQVAEAPAAQQTPTWLQTGLHEDYPAGKYRRAIGVGEDLKVAESSARGELAFWLNARLKRLAGRLRTSARDAPLARDLAWLREDALAFTKDDLTMARTAERWHDPAADTYYTFAVLDPSEAAGVLRGRLIEARDQAAGLLVSARNYRKAGNLGRSIREYAEAVAAAARVAALHAKALVVAPDEGDAVDALEPEPLLDQACREMAELLAEVKLQKVQGDLQWVQPGGPPREPLAVMALAGEPAQPAAGLAVKFSLAEGAAVGRATTDEQGIARWRPYAALQAGPRGSVIIAELELEGLPVDLSRLPQPRAEFHYMLRSKDNTRLVVYVRERTESGQTLSTPLADALERALRDEGIRLASPEQVQEHVRTDGLATDSPEDVILSAFEPLRKALEPNGFLLVVVGDLRPHVTESSPVEGGELYFAKCPYKLRVLDPGLPTASKVVLTVEGSASGAYLEDRLEALQRARREALAKAVPQLVSGLMGKLGP